MFYIAATWFIDSINYLFEHVVQPVYFRIEFTQNLLDINLFKECDCVQI
jgi:hypothetical protein